MSSRDIRSFERFLDSCKHPEKKPRENIEVKIDEIKTDYSAYFLIPVFIICVLSLIAVFVYKFGW